MFRIICLLIGYSLGLFQTAYIVGRLNGIDIRDHGSKNAGFTNTNRVLGRKMGGIVFVADIVKAVLAFLAATLVYRFSGDGPPAMVLGLYGGVGAILGHVYPFYLKFKGGKGVSCTLGVIIMLSLMLSPWVMAIAFALGIVAVATTRYISVASLLITLSVPILMALWGYGLEPIVLMGAVAVFIWYLHRANIGRLLGGTENKFSLNKK